MKPAIKFDDDKPATDQIPVRPLLEIAKVFGFGGKKYGRDNWKAGDRRFCDRLYGSCLRHLFAWRSGELLDSESGLEHLSHALTTIFMLTELDRGLNADKA